MLRHLGLIVACACIFVGVGCDGGNGLAPTPPPPSTVTVAFSGRAVNADAGDPVGGVRVSVTNVGVTSGFRASSPTDTAASGGDGAFTLPLTLPRDWSVVGLQLTRPGYDGRAWRFERNTAGTRAEIQMYPTLVIRPGESIDVRVEPAVTLCAFGGVIHCRRVLVEASPGEPVELEIVPHDTSKPMGLAADEWDETSVLRLFVAPGGVVYVHGEGTARLGRLTARR